ncbi:hypothetical protein M2323_002034 [Rhodoblastus acidophilus]|uniref:hypothetical protein n=1 Tax=Rhodoblastus acidophilus TaxID=1074 RepID=UPI0022247ADC|nr:hypothetical protein [Rhodoblastus acidophilus]MCW2285740.1 hypothetical protein [Rhodoblastus acidophilus]MCW2333112.1 hypothetical protein [Rhodoblastus acidophilus]
MDSDFGFYLHMGVDALLVAFVALAWAAPHIERAFGRGGGRWRDLAKNYPASGPAPKEVRPRQSLMVGPVLYRDCISVGADDTGLYLAPGRPLSFALKHNLRIPWPEIVKTEPAKVLWGKGVTLFIGAPALATLTVKAELFEKLVRPRLAGQARQ